MKYRIKSLYFVKGKRIQKKLRAKRRAPMGLSVLPPTVSKSEEREYIDLQLLFALGELPEAKKQKLKKHRLKKGLKKAASSIRLFADKVGLKVRTHFAKKVHKPQRIAFLSGVFVSATLVTALCAAGILAKLFLPYMKGYTPVIVPELVGKNVELAESGMPDGFELLISYENSQDVAAGLVISQRPEAGVVRKIFKNGDPCIITVTVSAGKNYYKVEDLVGTDSRLALLSLYNQGVSVKEEYAYSDTVPEGQVIGSTPSVGAILYEGEALNLKISLGKKIATVSVPDLYGLSEAQAKTLLYERGLQLGEVTYANSTANAGTIIRQQYAPYEKIAEGSTVNVTVSLGSTTEQKTVPDLYGLTAEEAEKRLAEVGLVLGSIYSVSSGAPKGTVVTQTPIAGTFITSSITSVDIYISS